MLLLLQIVAGMSGYSMFEATATSAIIGGVVGGSVTAVGNTWSPTPMAKVRECFLQPCLFDRGLMRVVGWWVTGSLAMQPLGGAPVPLPIRLSKNSARFTACAGTWRVFWFAACQQLLLDPGGEASGVHRQERASHGQGWYLRWHRE